VVPARDLLLVAADGLLERTPLLVLATLLDPAARVFVLEERPVALTGEPLRAFGLAARRRLAERALGAVFLEAERAREVLERALEVRRALERDRALLVETLLAERDLPLPVVLFPARLGLHTHTHTAGIKSNPVGVGHLYRPG